MPTAPIFTYKTITYLVPAHDPAPQLAWTPPPECRVLRAQTSKACWLSYIIHDTSYTSRPSCDLRCNGHLFYGNPLSIMMSLYSISLTSTIKFNLLCSDSMKYPWSVLQFQSWKQRGQHQTEKIRMLRAGMPKCKITSCSCQQKDFLSKSLSITHKALQKLVAFKPGVPTLF